MININGYSDCDNYSIVLFLTIYIICILTLYILYNVINNNYYEHLTLKTVCDERDRSCYIACTKKDYRMDKACFQQCQTLSPIC